MVATCSLIEICISLGGSRVHPLPCNCSLPCVYNMVGVLTFSGLTACYTFYMGCHLLSGVIASVSPLLMCGNYGPLELTRASLKFCDGGICSRDPSP